MMTLWGEPPHGPLEGFPHLVHWYLAGGEAEGEPVDQVREDRPDVRRVIGVEAFEHAVGACFGGRESLLDKACSAGGKLGSHERLSHVGMPFPRLEYLAELAGQRLRQGLAGGRRPHLLVHLGVHPRFDRGEDELFA